MWAVTFGTARRGLGVTDVGCHIRYSEEGPPLGTPIFKPWKRSKIWEKRPHLSEGWLRACEGIFASPSGNPSGMSSERYVPESSWRRLFVTCWFTRWLCTWTIVDDHIVAWFSRLHQLLHKQAVLRYQLLGLTSSSQVPNILCLSNICVTLEDYQIWHLLFPRTSIPIQGGFSLRPVKIGGGVLFYLYVYREAFRPKCFVVIAGGSGERKL